MGTEMASAGRRFRPFAFSGVQCLLSGLGLLPPSPRGPRELVVAGLDGEVLVERDERGIPWVHAHSMQDALFAQGYLHGLERGFQMDFARRAATGRLAEWFGRRALAHDRFMRRLNFRYWAEASVATWSDNTRRYLAAYARGVNLAFQTAPLPAEFRLLRSRPEPWRESDTNLLIFQFGWILNRAWLHKWARHQIGQDPEVRAWLLDPLPGPEAPTILPGPKASAEGLGGVGSNAWVVAGWRTELGASLLANDPHVAPTFPANWYLMMLEGGALHAFGATIPGAPGVVIGQSQEIAWGLTNLNADVFELVEIGLEEDGGRYSVQGRWHRLGVREERIRVRGGGEVVELCRDSHLGPVIAELSPRRVVALAWTGFEPQPAAQALLRLNLAHDWESFNLALAEWWVPAQNILYTDRSGHIGYVAAGRLPRRPEPVEGPLADGNARSSPWAGFWDWQAHPRLFDPPTGVIVAANNPPGGLEPVAGVHSLGFRAARIAERLAERPRHSVESLAAIFNDVRAEPLVAVRDRLLAAAGIPASWRPLLETFDGEVTPDAVAPTLIYAFMLEVIPEKVRAALRRPFFGEQPGLALAFPRHFWWLLYERLAPAVLAFWEHLEVAAATWRAQERLTRDLGRDPAEWRWGRAHRLVWLHPFARVPLVRALFSRHPLPVAGDGNYTVCGALFEPNADTRWPKETAVLPTLRAIFSPGQPEVPVAVVWPGQSGHPASPHSDDQVGAWQAGQLFPIGPGMEVGDWITMFPDRPPPWPLPPTGR